MSFHIPWKVSHFDELVVVFFIGGANDAIAWDWSDTIYFWVSAHYKALTFFQQAWYYDWLPFFYELMFAIMAYVLARFRPGLGWTVLWIYFAFMLSSSFLSFFILPQAQQGWFMGFTILSGSVVSAFLTLGMLHRVRHFGRL